MGLLPLNFSPDLVDIQRAKSATEAHPEIALSTITSILVHERELGLIE